MLNTDCNSALLVGGIMTLKQHAQNVRPTIL